MIKYEYVDRIIYDLINSGSSISYLKELRTNSIDILSKDISLNEALNEICAEIEYLSHMFLDKRNMFDTNIISGFSTGIYLPDYKSGSFKYTLVGGNASRSNDNKIDFNTVFDVASITKLYTLLLAFKLEELGYINLDDKVSDLNHDFINLGDYTLNDLIKLYGELRTQGNINNATSCEEAYEIFKTLYVFNNDKNLIKYNDFGSMVIADTISKVISDKLGKQMSFDEIMYEYLFKPLNLNHTMFNPTSNISGNGYSCNYPHDPKARLFNGVQGHAGIFTNSSDLMSLSDMLFLRKFLNQEHLSRLSKSNNPNSIKGNMGLYLKHPDGYKMTYNPSEYSHESFTSQGWTGSIASFDLINRIHNSILVNAIVEDESDKISNNKPKMFLETFDQYQMNIVKRIMLMYIVKKYYNRYCNISEDIEVKRTLKI